MQIVPLLVIRRLASVTTTQEQQCRSAPSLPSSYACPHCSDWQTQVSRRIPRSAMPVSTRAPRPTWNAAGTAISPPAMVVVTQKVIAAPIDDARSMTEFAARDYASLSPAEYEALISRFGFHVLQHVANDPEAGGRTVWLCQKQ